MDIILFECYVHSLEDTIDAYKELEERPYYNSKYNKPISLTVDSGVCCFVFARNKTVRLHSGGCYFSCIVPF